MSKPKKIIIHHSVGNQSGYTSTYKEVSVEQEGQAPTHYTMYADGSIEVERGGEKELRPMQLLGVEVDANGKFKSIPPSTRSVEGAG